MYIFFIFFCFVLFWNIAFQMPASLRMCKMRTLLTAASMSWNRDSQKIFTSVKDNPVQPPFLLDWWLSSCHKVNLQSCDGETAPPPAGRMYCRDCAEQRAVLVSYEERCDCLSLKFLETSKWEGVYRLIGTVSVGNTALWINIKWKGCKTT